MAQNDDAHRAQVVAAKQRRHRATVDNATAENEGRTAPHSTADLEAMRLAVDIAAYEARQNHVSLDGIVGPNVGLLDPRQNG